MRDFNPQPRIGTSFEKMGHTADIERWNKEMGGLLNIYARLSHQEQKEVMSTVKALKAETQEPEMLLERLRALAVMYGAVSRNLEPGSESLPAALTWRLGELDRSLEENRGKQPGSKDTVH